MLFKEKQMGVIRVHGILPVSTAAFILSKLCIFLMSDLVFVIFLTLVNLGVQEGTAVLPAVLVQSGILSLIMALVGFLCAVRLPDFKQFSLFISGACCIHHDSGVSRRTDRGCAAPDQVSSDVSYVHGSQERILSGTVCIGSLLFSLCGSSRFCYIAWCTGHLSMRW